MRILSILSYISKVYESHMCDICTYAFLGFFVFVLV